MTSYFLKNNYSFYFILYKIKCQKKKKKKKEQKQKIKDIENINELLEEDKETKEKNEHYTTEFSEDFRDILFDTMWTFINPELIVDIFDDLGIHIEISTKRSVNDDDFEDEKYHDTICFKGPRSKGHYVYVDENGNDYGTFEKNLLVNDSDDGVCHGVAMIYAYNAHNKRKTEFPIVTGRNYRGKYTRSNQKNLENYRTILNFYLFLCKSKAWKKM